MRSPGLSIPTGTRELIEFLALSGLLLMLSTGPVYFIAQHVLHAESDWESRPIKVGFILCGLIGAAVWASMAIDHRIIRFSTTLVPATAFVALAVVSTWWSILPRQTLWRSSVYIGMFLIAWALASLDFDRLWAVIILFTGSGTLASIFVAVARPSMGVAESGYWRGIYTSPNSLGPVSALFITALIAIALMDRRTVTRITVAVLTLVALVPLIRSNATTSMAALALAIVSTAIIWLISDLRRRGQNRRSLVVMAAAGIGAILIGIPAGVIAARTSGIQQRLEVWPVVWQRILIKPWTGYGFFTYWGTRASTQPRTIGRAGSAHNSVLESGLDVGTIAMVVTTAMLVVAVIVGIRRVLRDPTIANAALLAVTVFVVSSHLTESFVSWFSYMWILLVVLAAHPGQTDNTSTPPVSVIATEEAADG